jgi:hypothetical protein
VTPSSAHHFPSDGHLFYPRATGRPMTVKASPFRQCLNHGLKKCGNDLNHFVEGGWRAL